MTLRKLSAVAGVAVLAMIPVWALWAFPAAVEMTARDVDLSLEMEGSLSLLNSTTGAMDESEITLVRTISSSDSGEWSIINETTKGFRSDTGTMLPSMFQLSAEIRADPVDRSMADGVQWSFPMDTQPRDYLMLDGELTAEAERDAIQSDTVLLAYSGEEERAGLNCMVFKQETRLASFCVDPAFGAPEGTAQDILINTTYWVEPECGLIVDMARTSERHLTFPDLARLPDNLALNLTLRGTAQVLNTTLLLFNSPYDWTNITVSKSVKSAGMAGEVMMVATETGVYDSEIGRRMDESFQYPATLDGVDPRSAEIVPGYGDDDRTGLFTFPMGAQKTNLTVWSYETGQPALAVFTGTEDRGGVEVYSYEVSVDNATLGTMRRDGVEFERTQTMRMTYWVEPKTGFVVDVEGVLLQYGRFPNLARIPSDLSLSYEIDGWARMLDEANLDPDDPYDEFSMRLIKNVTVVSADGERLVVETSTEGSRGDGGILPADFTEPLHSLEVDSRTAQVLAGGSGRLSFPVGAFGGEYWLYSTEAKRVLPAKYVRDETVMRVPARVFRVEAEGLFVEERPIMMSDRTMPLTYTGSVEYFVEPTTGYVLDVRASGEYTADMPVIAEIPPEMAYEFWFDGEMWSPLTGRQRINMTKEVRVAGTVAADGLKIRVIYDNNTMRNSTTGEVVSLGSVHEKCAVDSATSLHVINPVADADREGGFYFPQMCGRRDYQVWNSEIQMPDEARYQKDVVVDGLECYQYMVDYIDRPIGPGLAYDNRVVYTVEPVSGMIVDTILESSQKASGFPYTELKLRCTEACRANKTAEAKWLKGVITLLNDREVPAAVFSYGFTNGQVVKNAEEAEKMRSQITLSDRTVNIARISLRMDPLCSERMLEAAGTNSTLLAALSGRRVLAMHMELAFSPETKSGMADLASDARRQLMLGDWGLPTALALLGGILVMVPVAAHKGGGKDD